MKPKRIFIGLTEVSGYYSNLKKGFDQLKVSAELISLHRHKFQYGDKESHGAIPAFARYCVEKRLACPSRRPLYGLLWLTMTFISRLCLLIWALCRFDVFIMGGGSSFFRYTEFPLLRLFGKKIIYILHGTDLRPPYIDGIREGSFSPSAIDGAANNGVDHESSLGGFGDVAENDYSYYVRIGKKRKKVAARIEKYANVVVTLASVGHFLTEPFVQWLIVGSPLHVERKPSPIAISPERNMITILHCPSHLEAKGTREIRKAIAAARREGHPIKYLELYGRPNFEILNAIERCDFVVDQVYSDVPMAAFGTEAAFLGKPVVVGGYYSSMIRHDLEEKWIAPSLFCHPDDIEQAIKKLIVDKDFRTQLGQRAREFVEKNWTAKFVAQRYVRLIKGDIPSEWLYDPQRIRYVHGMGLREEKARTTIRTLIERYGKQVLMLSDKPELEKRFIEFVYTKNS